MNKEDEETETFTVADNDEMTIQDILKIYQTTGKLISKTIYEGTNDDKDLFKVMCCLHQSSTVYDIKVSPKQKCVQNIENLEKTLSKAVLCSLSMTKREILKVLLHQFLPFGHKRSDCHLGSNIYVNALKKGKEEVVEYLENSCAVDISLFQYPLHLAVECSHLQTMKVLVHEKGLNINTRDSQGNTPLHWFVEYAVLQDTCSVSKMTSIVRWLEENGGSITLVNNENISPFMSAALLCRQWLVDRWSGEEYNIETLTKILALELLSASLSKYDKQRAIHSYEKALAMRDKYNIPCTTHLPGRYIFCNYTEPDSVEELTLLLSSHEGSLLFECLVYERILGTSSYAFLETCTRLERDRFKFYKEAVEKSFAQRTLDLFHFRRGIILRKRKIFMRERNCYQLRANSDDFVNPLLFIDMFQTHRESIFIQVNSSVIENEEINKFLRFHCTLMLTMSKCPHSKNYVFFNNIVSDFSQLIFIVLARTNNEGEKLQIKQLLQQAVFIGKKLSFSSCFLSVVITNLTQQSFIYGNAGNRIKVWVDIIEMLLQCGCNPSQSENVGDNAMHHICSSLKSIQDHFNVNNIVGADWDFGRASVHFVQVIKSMLEAGVHVDAVNSEGKTPLQLTENTEFKSIFQNHINLQCICAFAIVKYKLSRNSLSDYLQQFIKLHEGRIGKD